MLPFNGVTKINNAVKNFVSVVNKIQDGIKLCEYKKKENLKDQGEISAQNAVLDKSIEKGKRIIGKINEIIG